MDDVRKELEKLFDDPLLKMSDREKDLFTLPDMLKVKCERQASDYVAQKKRCDNFEQYEVGFKQVHEDLRNGNRMLKKYSGESNIQEGHYYVLSGILVYLDKLIGIKKTKRAGGHWDGRTRVIYENGTESDITYRTLGKNIQLDGYIVTENKDSDITAIEDSFQKVDKDDIADGYIYVLSSLSEEPQIRKQPDLYKIGFSTTPVEERIRNCEYEPTFLMDKVRIVAVWKTYNMKTHAFESIIHQFFQSVRFHVKVKDLAGNEVEPQEWFVVPLGIIERAVRLIIDGSITDYCYNPQLQMLEKIEKKNDNMSSEQIDTTGWAILSLRVKQIYFDEIASGNKRIEYRDLKQSQLNKYTWVDQATGKRYLRKFDALRLFVGNTSGGGNRMLVEVVDTNYNPVTRQVEYSLGTILQISSTNDSCCAVLHEM